MRKQCLRGAMDQRIGLLLPNGRWYSKVPGSSPGGDVVFLSFLTRFSIRAYFTKPTYKSSLSQNTIFQNQKLSADAEHLDKTQTISCCTKCTTAARRAPQSSTTARTYSPDLKSMIVCVYGYWLSVLVCGVIASRVKFGAKIISRGSSI